MNKKKQYLLIIAAICVISCTNTPEEIIYTSDENGNPEIYSSDLTNKEKTKLTDHYLRDGYGVYSPDNNKIAFYSYCDSGETWAIFTMNADGSDRKRLTNAANHKETRPAWSSDGNKIVFSRAAWDYSDLSIWLMNADGTEQMEIPGISGIPSDFTQDGKVIYNSHWDATSEIFIADINGSNIIQITNNDYSDTQGQLSPDGNRIAFVSRRDGDQEIYLMDIDGNNQKRLTESPGSDVGPKWSPDGSKILFGSNRDGDWDVYIINPDGTEIKNITDNRFNVGQASWKR